MPVGYLVTVTLLALVTVVAVVPLRRPRGCAAASHGLGSCSHRCS
jgi:hypothetical protein